MSLSSVLGRKKKDPQPPGSFSPSERAEQKVFERSILEEIMGKMERTEATIEEKIDDGHGKTKSVPKTMSQSHKLAKDIMLAITPSLGLGRKAPLIKENIFGLQDLAMLAALDELYNGREDTSTKGMNLVVENTTLSMFPRAMTDELRRANIVQKEDPETKVFLRYLLSRDLGMNVATQLEKKEGEEE